jgi:alkanesulfonate monooxygenase SsuD/methylene tetrahydromethanopterin reductase-like flavin-dependent oxidoreductase (luciferase family)
MRFGIVADFRNPRRWYKPFPDLYADILAQIRIAEDLGYDNVWLTEHHFTDDGYNPSILTAAAAIAARTSRIRIGSFVLLLPYQDPVRAAEDIASVDILSNGRFDLGLGQGYSFHEFNALRIKRNTRARRLYEGIDILKKLFQEERVTYDGEFTQITGLRLSPKPVQKPCPPIWIGARGPKGIKRAAEHGHNLIATFGPDPAPLYCDTLTSLGRDPKDYKIGQLRMVYIAESEEQAWDECQDHLFHMIDFYKDIVADAMDAEGDEKPFPVDKPEDLRDSPVKDGVMIGTVQQVCEKMEAFRNSFMCTDLVTAMQFPGMSVEKVNHSMAKFAKEVMPQFREI